MAVFGAVHTGVPLATVLGYDLYFVVGVVLPGLLLVRAFWRSTGNWVEDFALGAAVGIVYQFAGWAGFTALGIQPWLKLWPAALLVAFAVVPKLRQYWRIATPAPLPHVWSWGVALSLAVMLFAVLTGPMLYHLAPGVAENNLDQQFTPAYHQDMLFHLSMVHELMRSVPPQLPQVAGLPLDYHWFANADMAAAAHLTGLSPELVLFRLWPVPLTAVVVLLTATLARQVSRQWIAAVIAVAILAVPASGALIGHRRLSVVGNLIYYPSPSQTFALVVLTAAAVFFVEALYRRGRPGVWVLATALAVVGGGAKPTVLPLLLGGAGLAGLYLAVRKRGVPARSLLACGFLLIAGVIAMLTVTGSTGGSGLRPLAVLRTMGTPYRATTGDTSLAATGDFLLRPIAEGRVSAVLVLLAVVLIGQVGLLVGAGLLASRRTRTDPTAWFLLGTLAAAWAAFLLVDHPSSSEFYFLRGAVPFAAVAAAWMVTVAIRGRAVHHLAGPVVASLLYGVLIFAAQQWVEEPVLGTGWTAVLSVARGVVVFVVLALLAWFCWHRVVAARADLAGVGLLVPVLVVMGMAFSSMVDQARSSRESTAPLVYSAKYGLYNADEQEAASWLQQHSAPDDVVATNTACLSQRRDCVALGYLVSGLAGRRTLLEGWGYTQQVMSLHGIGGKGYMLQPSPWRDRWELTTRLFSRPDPSAIRSARDRYGVRWLFVDRVNGRPATVATGEGVEVAFRNRGVTVVRITGN
ncbi:hypothetical protein [Kribbella italica]|uniref:Uncharacterized protein n=1 Tax=Kribbella italica TaxID=1540520 RepID=A0A7W9J8W5_9ACTN|nr:hypothetical protein [Kribbella italica]MBB5837325.1 hypothetical protein [Kribbella italica]